MRRYIVLPAVILLGVLGALEASAQGLLGPSTPYRLTSDAALLEGCFDPCDCPLLLRPLAGRFTLVPTGFDGLFWNFDVTSIHWRSTATDGTPSIIMGSGRYRVGGEVAAMHELTLDLATDGGPPEHFDSGLVTGGGTFPRIDISPSLNGQVCWDRVFEVHARPAPRLAVDRDWLSWPEITGADRFDVVSGSLAVLRASGGDFAEATSWCLADDVEATEILGDEDPAPGECTWYVLRLGGDAPGMSYDSDTPEQAGPRDPGIEQTSVACP